MRAVRVKSAHALGCGAPSRRGGLRARRRTQEARQRLGQDNPATNASSSFSRRAFCGPPPPVECSAVRPQSWPLASAVDACSVIVVS